MSCLVIPRMRQAFIALGLVYACTTPGLVQASDLKGLEGSTAASPVEGTYKGTAQLIAADTASCRPGSEVALEVHGGRMKLPWMDHEFFDAKIENNGAFFANAIPTAQAEKHMTVNPTLEGHVSGEGLTADYGTRLCRYRLVATRSPDTQHFSARTDAPGSRQ